MNRRDPNSPHPADRPRSDDGRYAYRERLGHVGPTAPRTPATDYPYGPGFSQSGGSYVEVESDRGHSGYGGDAYQRVRPWGPEDGTERYGPDSGRGGPWGDQELRETRREGGGGRRDASYGPDIEPPRDFRGRGPRGYVRSDERLKEIVCERLYEDPRIDASDVTVDVTGGVVTLSGEVDSRRTKHLLEDLVDDCRGVQSIDNRLRIPGQRSDA